MACRSRKSSRCADVIRLDDVFRRKERANIAPRVRENQSRTNGETSLIHPSGKIVAACSIDGRLVARREERL
jgi:hypothetical protein